MITAIYAGAVGAEERDIARRSMRGNAQSAPLK